MICKNCGKSIPPESVYCMFCGAPIFSSRGEPLPSSPPPEPAWMPEPPRITKAKLPPMPPAKPISRVCVVCGCELPQESPDDICASCQFVQDFAASATLEDAPEPFLPPKKEFKLELDLEEEYEDAPVKSPRKPRKPLPRWLLPVILAVILVGILLGGWFLLADRIQGESQPAHTSSAISEPSPQAQEAASYAQEMVKAAARDPASVHFQKSTLSIASEQGEYIVTQEFERADATGQMIAAKYEAILTLEATADKPYTPLMLKVDDDILFDYR